MGDEQVHQHAAALPPSGVHVGNGGLKGTDLASMQKARCTLRVQDANKGHHSETSHNSSKKEDGGYERRTASAAWHSTGSRPPPGRGSTYRVHQHGRQFGASEPAACTKKFASNITCAEMQATPLCSEWRVTKHYQ